MKPLACLSFTKAQTRPTIQSDSPLMKAGSNYLYNPLPTKGSSQEHRDEISAYLSQHHSPKTNTPVCLWHTKAVINMAHWSEHMYSHSIRRQLSSRWREGKNDVHNALIWVRGNAFFSRRANYKTVSESSREKRGEKDRVGNITSLVVGLCLYQNCLYLHNACVFIVTAGNHNATFTFPFRSMPRLLYSTCIID